MSTQRTYMHKSTKTLQKQISRAYQYDKNTHCQQCT